MTTRTQIVDTARKATGTPWVHQGRLALVGIDCAGLVLWTGRQHGMLLDFEPPPYDREAKWDEFLRYFQEHLIEVPWNSAREGSVLVFRQNIYPCHCGIMTVGGDDPKFIHSYAVRRKVVEERYTQVWRSVTRAAFEYPGVD